MSLRWCESPGNAARIAALSADQAPTAIIGCPHMESGHSLKRRMTPVRHNRTFEPSAGCTVGVIGVRRSAVMRPKGEPHQRALSRPGSLLLHGGSPAPPLQASKSESIDSSIGAYVEPLLGRNQSLEPMQARHRPRRPGEKRLPGVPSEAVEPIIAFGADDPHYRIRMPIRGGHDR